MSLVGKVIGTWKLVARLGAGGMGEVYLAEHQTIGRKAAVKVLHPEYAAQPTVVERFFNEARAANKVKHPSIIEVWDYGQAPDVGAYFVMEFLEGESLQHRLDARHKLAAPDVASLLSRVAAAVGAAHKAGIIHRDLKPDNIYILPDSDHPSGERVKVLDFGIAKLAGDAGLGGSKTRTGSVMGTPVYMSPEQCHGAKSVDSRTDIYALGVIAYEALCGRPPFVAQGFGEMLAKHLSQAPQPLHDIEPSVPAKLEQVVLKALAKEPDDRWKTMEEMAAALVDAVEGVRRSHPPELRATEILDPDGAKTVQATTGVRRSTLSSSAAEIAPPAARGGGLRIGIGIGAGLAVGAAVVVSLFVWGPLSGSGADDTGRDEARDHGRDDARHRDGPKDRDDPKRHGVTAAAGPGDEHPATAAATAAPEPSTAAGSARPATAATASAKAKTVRHIIESEPAGTVVRVSDGAELGTTPWDSDDAAAPGKIVYEVRREGFKPARVTLSAARDDRKSVKLVSTRKAPKTGAPATATVKTPKEPGTHAPELPTPD